MKIEETIKELGVPESKKDKAVITNFDYYRDQIYEIGINDMAFDEENGKLCNCRDIK